MRILKTNAFNKWARITGISDSTLKDAVDEIVQGLVGDNLGGNLFKKRIASNSGGKSGGSRTILIYRKNDRAIFLYGFEKNVRSNIKVNELKALKTYANILLGFDAGQLEKAIADNILFEVMTS